MAEPFLLSKNVAVKSIGCRTNQEEMNSLRFKLQNCGYKIVEDLERADIIIVNTCTVTSSTESKTNRFLSAISVKYPNAKILLTGCLAQQKPEELKKVSSTVQWVVGNTRKDDIPQIISMQEGIYHEPFNNEQVSQFPQTLPVATPAEKEAGFRTRFPIKIQEGCNFRCTYCIVPSVRGPSRSLNIDNVLKVCKTAIDSGYKELVLTGTHIGQFGKTENYSLEQLLHKIVQIEGDFRVRLSSLDPRDLSEEILQLVGSNPKICDHLHVSAQSFSEAVLNNMGRPFNQVNSFVGMLRRFRERFPSAGLGADLIVGFPGETEDDFLKTMEYAESIEFSYAHVFRYSARPGTPSCNFDRQIPETLKTERSDRLRTLIEKSRIAFLKKNNTVFKKIIVESEYPVRGLTSNYLHVEIPGFRKQCNSWLDVFITDQRNGRFHLAEPV